MSRKYRVLICDDSEKERQRFYSRQWSNFDILGVVKEGDRFVELDPIDSVDKLHQRVLTMRDQGTLPDLIVLDLFYKKPLPNVDEVERTFVEELLTFKQEFFRLKRKDLDHLVPAGITILQRIREVDRISAMELPVAVYTDKNFNFLPSEAFNLLYKLDVGSVHKDRDDDPLLNIEPSSEYFRLLHTIERNRSVSQTTQRRIFISHGRSPDWMQLQLFLEKELRISTIELTQQANHGATVIGKLQGAADQCYHAIIIMTGEDLGVDGNLRVRENVMHEIGYFQGRLGLDRVSLLHEEGVSIPSNLGGIVYFPFASGNIASVFGRLMRELV
ncbi:MAG: TIR domain-containing protein [Thermoanaerobaculia bacterium]